MTTDQRTLLVVAGPGRSGTSLFTTTAQRLGFHVPQPEIVANASNPRGFGEPRWAVDFHERLMREANVFIEDTRPKAYAAAAKVGRRPEVRAELEEWLAEQFDQAPKVAVKDPRITWFVSLYSAVSPALDAQTSAVTALRHPVETAASRQMHYGSRISPTGLLAAWLNQSVLLEQRTRDIPRGFVRYHEMLADWREELEKVERHSGLPLISSASDEQRAEVDQLVDPSLRRARATWEGLGVPGYLVEIAEDAWSGLCALAEDGDQPEHLARLDDVANRYREAFADARAVVRSVIRAADRAHADEMAAVQAGAEAAEPPPAELPPRDQEPRRGRLQRLVRRR